MAGRDTLAARRHIGSSGKADVAFRRTYRKNAPDFYGQFGKDPLFDSQSVCVAGLPDLSSPSVLPP